MTKVKHDANSDCREKRGFNQFISKHWWKILIGVGTVGGSIFLFKNRESLKLLFSNTQSIQSIENIAIGNIIQESIDDGLNMLPQVETINVSAHLRNLPNGWNASPNKLAEAAQQGIILAKHQTFVSPYTKGAA